MFSTDSKKNILVVVFLLAPITAQAAFEKNHVLRDKRGDIVHTMRDGSCVRTIGEAGDNICESVRVTRLSSQERNVFFEFNSATMTPSAKEHLDGVAKTLRNAEDVKSADIAGYADRIGSEGYNVDLSARRAEAVKNYLAEQGYLKTQVTTIEALGESRPVTDCSTELPRSKEILCLRDDRRVEVQVRYGAEYVSMNER